MDIPYRGRTYDLSDTRTAYSKVTLEDESGEELMVWQDAEPLSEAAQVARAVEYLEGLGGNPP